MAALSVTTSGPAGVELTLVAAAAGGDTVVNDGQTLLVVRNGSGAPITVTIASRAAIRPGLAQANATRAVSAGATAVIGPWPPADFNGDQGVSISYSAAASVTVAAVRALPTS